MPFNAKMTAICNEIRTLSGAVGILGLDAMTNNLSEANTEVNNQAELIAQIIEILDNKAVGGGGNTQTATVTAVIDAPVTPNSSLYYVSPSGLNTIDIGDYFIGDSFSFDCVVPSIISTTAAFMSIDGEISELYRINGNSSYYITGNSTLMYS